MNVHLIRLATGFIATAFLVACGGGGGSSSGGTTTPSTKKASTVSGTVALVSLNTLVAGRSKKVSVRKAAGAEAAQVAIRSYTKTGTEIGKFTLSTGATGAFAQDINLNDAGGYLVITVTKSGYADFSKRVDYDKPSSLNLRAELAKATAGAGSPDLNDANAINIGVVRNIATGVKTVYSGSALKSARKASGNQVELEMKLDTSSSSPLAGTTSVIGQFETFNSTDPTQALYFPGAYKGTDKNTNQSGQLVSMAFDYIDLNTNTGVNVAKALKKLAKTGKAGKAAAASAFKKVTRWVPQSSCDNLFLQNGSSIAGQWGVPIWSVDPYAGDGTWLKIGDGVVSTYDTTSSTYVPVSFSTPPTASEITNAKNACSTSPNGYYVDITVTNPEYLEKWWNLDHMILSSEAPKEVCVTGKLIDQNSKPLTDVWLYMYDDDYSQSFDYGYGVTSSTGAFTLKSALINNSDLDRSATISYYDPISYAYQEQAVTLGVSPNCGSQTITINRPAICTVKGALSGASANGDIITFYNGGNDYYYNYAYTNSDGSFSSEVPCDRSLEVYVGGNWSKSAVFNVDGVKGEFEASDSGTGAGSIVTLAALSKPNTPPETWGSLDTYYATTTQPVNAAVSAWDYDGDYPISYTISTTNPTTGKQLILVSGSITKAQAEAYSYPPVTLDLLPATGSYNLTMVATDSKGLSSMETPLGTLLIYDGSGSGGFAPSAWLYADHTLVNTTDLGTSAIPLYAYASDLDGAATLSYSWKIMFNGTDVTSTIGSALVVDQNIYNWGSDSYITASFTPPATVNSTAVANGSVFTIEFTATDSVNSATATADFNVGSVITYPGTITVQKPALFKKR